MKWLPRVLGPRGVVTDEQAMREVQASGDHRAFALLVERWEVPIRRLCARMTGDGQGGEDLAQETFARVFANRHQYVQGKRFSTWLWRIAVNCCLEDGRRTKRRDELTLGVAQRAEQAGPDAKLIDRERADLVREAVARLPDTHRVVVLLREYEGLTSREIAETLQIPEGTVKWRMADALTRLAEQLKPFSPETADERS
jgi:RNA polymerase sigma-70 factor (ECF subfamily)